MAFESAVAAAVAPSLLLWRAAETDAAFFLRSWIPSGVSERFVKGVHIWVYFHSRRAGGPMDLCPWKVWSTWKSEDKSPSCTVTCTWPSTLHQPPDKEKKRGKSTIDKAENVKISNVNNITLGI
jgi:hypothetical protein